MKKEFRVTKNEDFQKIIYYKHSVANKKFVVYYKHNDKQHMRVGISVSKKLGNAVVRNRIKRQVREMVDEIFNIELNFDFVVIIRQGFLNDEFHNNKKDLEFLWNKIIKS